MNIPPEGDEYNKQRETELYAAITNKAALVRRHAEMLRADAPSEQLNEAVAAMSQMERDIARLSLELHNSTQGRNLNIFMVRMDVSLAGVTNAIEGLRMDLQTSALGAAARLGELEARVDRIDVRHDELDQIQTWRVEADRRLAAIEQADRDGVHTELERIRNELAGVKSILSDRPAKREQEYRAIAEKAAEDAIKRLEARGDGDRS